MASRLISHYSKSRTAFLCVDIQTPFRRQVANFDACVFVANRFAAVHQLIPEHTSYIVTEQYPKGLGKTDPAVKIPSSAAVYSKLKYSCLIPEVESALQSCDNVVLFGVEGHVCVMQTASELLDSNKHVFLAVDGIGSRNSTDLKTALKEMARWGPQLTLTTSESLLFQMMRGADDKIFKDVLKLVVTQPPPPK